MLYYFLRFSLKFLYSVALSCSWIKRSSKVESFLSDLKVGKSFIRWGDGETALMLGAKTYFQQRNLNLILKLFMFLLRSRNAIGLVIVFPESDIMKKNKAYNSTYELFCVLKFFGWKNIRFCAMSFRNDQKTRDFFVKHVRKISKVLIICPRKFRPMEEKLESIFGKGTKLLYTEEDNPTITSDQLSSIYFGQTIVLAGGPLWKCTLPYLKKNLTTLDFGHGLDIVINS